MDTKARTSCTWKGAGELLTGRMGAALSWMDRMCVMLFLASCSLSLASDILNNTTNKDHECVLLNTRTKKCIGYIL